MASAGVWGLGLRDAHVVLLSQCCLAAKSYGNTKAIVNTNYLLIVPIYLYYIMRQHRRLIISGPLLLSSWLAYTTPDYVRRRKDFTLI